MLNSHFWSEIDYFKKNEFSCHCGCGFNTISHHLVSRLDRAREFSGIPFKINSACRCKKHNSSKEIKGSPNSSHLKGLAVDIHVGSASDRYMIVASLFAVGITRIGVYKDFIHCDMDNDKVQNVIWYK